MENPDIYSSDDESSKSEDEKNANEESDNETSDIDENLEETDDIEYEDTSDSDIDIDDDEDEEKLEENDEMNDIETDVVNEKTSQKKKSNKKEKAKRKPKKKEENEDEEDDEGDEEIENENYLQKFDENLKDKIIQDYHPELHQHNYEEIETLTKVVRDETGVIIDPFHKTLPFLTKYETAKIIGSRAMQIASGGKPFIQLESNVIDSYLIAMEELKQKKIPFIIKRPFPNGNGCEYWKLKDLEILE